MVWPEGSSGGGNQHDRWPPWSRLEEEIMVKWTPVDTENGQRVRWGTNRRQFIARGSAAVAAPWLLGSVGLSRAYAEITEAVATVGYLRGSDQFVRRESFLHGLDSPNPDLAATLYALRAEMGVVKPQEIVPAGYLLEGYGGFAQRPPTIWIHGLLPPPELLRTIPRSVTLEATFSVLQRQLVVRESSTGVRRSRRLGENADMPLAVLAWRYQSQPVVSSAAPNAFQIPVHTDQPLRLVVEVVVGDGQHDGVESEGTDPQGERLAATLSIGFMPGVSKLRPGTYFIALESSAGGRLPLVANHDYLVPDDFPCLAFSVLESPSQAG